ncbi:MAG TPA: hypothetical protein VIV63_12365 [Steroidobacteraceae bacterium]
MSKLLSGFLVFGVVMAIALPPPVYAGDKPATPRNIAPPTRIPDPVVAEAPGEHVDIASVPRAVRRAVVADAARRFAVSENEVVLINAESVTWSDGSMGCPQPGQMYTQMLVPGFRLAAKTSAGQMVYHTDSRGTVVNCAAGKFQTGPKQLSAHPAHDGTGTGAEPRTQPPQPKAPDR